MVTLGAHLPRSFPASLERRGVIVATLVDREGHPGVFTVNWRGVRDDGSAVGSGEYFARMTTAGRTTGCKLVLLK